MFSTAGLLQYVTAYIVRTSFSSQGLGFDDDDGESVTGAKNKSK